MLLIETPFFVIIKVMVKQKQSYNENESIVWEVIKTVGGILLFLVVFRFYLFQPFSISGSSMEPTFKDGEYLIVNELSYHLGSPKRGDVVVFKHPDPACTEHIGKSYFHRVFLQGPCENYIKRVIGLPGETVIIRDGKVAVKTKENPGGKVLDEGYIGQNIKTYGSQEVTLGKKEYYVLGDNRNPNASSDSREWGVLPRKNIVGKALIVLLPVDSFQKVKDVKY